MWRSDDTGWLCSRPCSARDLGLPAALSNSLLRHRPVGATLAFDPSFAARNLVRAAPAAAPIRSGSRSSPVPIRLVSAEYVASTSAKYAASAFRVWLVRTPGAYHESPAHPLDAATQIRPVRVMALPQSMERRPSAHINERGAPAASEAVGAAIEAAPAMPPASGSGSVRRW